jgi:hypothetical protein
MTFDETFNEVDAATALAEQFFSEFRLGETNEWIVNGETMFVDLTLTAYTPGGSAIWVCSMPNSGMVSTLVRFLAVASPSTVRTLLQEIVRLQNLVAFLQADEATK